MKLVKPIGIALVVLAGQFCAYSAELAVLRNGFTIRFERKEPNGDVTRLYTQGGFVDVATSEIASFEHEETPNIPAPEPAATASTTPTTSATGAQTIPGSTASRAPMTPAELDQVIRDASSRHQIDPDFVNSVIKAESNFHPRAVSRKGAQGLMQLMPATASKLGVKDPFDPVANVEAGTAHLSALLDLYNNDPIKALAAYNAGAHRVEQYHGVPPYHETRAYVARIVHDFNVKKQAQAKAATNVAKDGKATKKKTAPPSAPQQAGASKPQKPA